MALYTRWEHGNFPVTKRGDSWILHSESEKIFSTWKDLRTYLYGRDVEVNFKNYFRIKPVEDHFVVYEEYLASLLSELEERVVKTIRKTKLGIDISSKRVDIRKLVLSGFYKQILVNGYDPEDVVQEVYKGLIIRNQGKCPWDSSKSSFGHYVHMVARCVLENYKRKNKRIEIPESAMGEETYDLGDELFVSIEDSGDLESFITTRELHSFLLKNVSEEKRSLISEVFPLVVSQHKIKDIASIVKRKEEVVSPVVREIRNLTAKWAYQQQLTHLVPEKYVE